jgi:hypothetical protein
VHNGVYLLETLVDFRIPFPTVSGWLIFGQGLRGHKFHTERGKLTKYQKQEGIVKIKVTSVKSEPNVGTSNLLLPKLKEKRKDVVKNYD